MKKHIGIIGAGWAGLAAAITAIDRGHRITVLDMAPYAGGRARALPTRENTPHHDIDITLDNGQHILIGAYRETLRLMQQVGVDLEQVLIRKPLELLDAKGQGLSLTPGSAPAVWAFVKSILDAKAWPLHERLRFLGIASGWGLRRFRCPADWTVQRLIGRVPASIQRDLLRPLCIAALNTPASHASASVFLRVLQDALFSGPGSSDLLLPRVPLNALFPDPAIDWLRGHGPQATVMFRQRVKSIIPLSSSSLSASTPAKWRLHTADAGISLDCDHVVLACSPTEAARLALPIAPPWSRQAQQLRHEPIITVVLRSLRQPQLAHPMIALPEGPQAPAQFLFDFGQLRVVTHADNAKAQGLYAAVISHADAWRQQGLAATAQAVQGQLGALLGPTTVVHTCCEKNATFFCTPELQRPPMFLAPGLHGAGDYIDGPYPSTLEGAVRSGIQAVETF